MRWSALKKLLEELFDPELKLSIFCTVHRGRGGPDIGRYWITLDGDTIWEVPRDVHKLTESKAAEPVATEITAVLREYLDCSKEDLFSKRFDGDRWRLTDVLRAADRRIGKRRFVELVERGITPAGFLVLQARGFKLPAPSS
jgi:hypothetical protein